MVLRRTDLEPVLSPNINLAFYVLVSKQVSWSRKNLEAILEQSDSFGDRSKDQ